MARHIQSPVRPVMPTVDLGTLHDMVREEMDKTRAAAVEQAFNAAMVLEAERLITAIADSVRRWQAGQPVTASVGLVGRAQMPARNYQVSVPGLLAGALRSTPTAVKHLRQQFAEASVVNRGRGTTMTIVLRSDEQARWMLAALEEAAQQITHRDIVRAAAELRAELGEAA